MPGKTIEEERKGKTCVCEDCGGEFPCEDMNVDESTCCGSVKWYVKDDLRKDIIRGMYEDKIRALKNAIEGKLTKEDREALKSMLGSQRELLERHKKRVRRASR